MRSQLPVEVYDLGPHHVFLELDSEEAVAALEPDFGALGAFDRARGQLLRRLGQPLEDTDVRADERRRRGSRDRLGAPDRSRIHLARHGRIAFGEEVEIVAGRRDRPSVEALRRVDGAPEQIERVEVGGSAVVVARGEFRL